LCDIRYNNHGHRWQFDNSQGDAEQVFAEIGRLLVNELAENNPEYMQRILMHALQLRCDKEFVELQNRRLSMYATPSQQPRPLINDDYDYWWEFGEDESSVVIMCNYDGMPESGLDRIEFEFDNEEERETAIEEGEKIVKQLNNNEIPLSKFFTNVSKPVMMPDSMYMKFIEELAK
jgi:hypothetical protein